MSDVTIELLYLSMLVVGLLVVGAGVGLMIYHYGLGWFLSHYSKDTVNHVVDAAERHLTRRTERRHRRERERRILAENDVGRPVARHLASRR